ncbi:hypothetical protein PK35_05790 [Tamlana nanhaiensis]|uniref:Uncharacterized protein n=1 Tax=Neotamlana nanhaiensis TaxID=1382798 RepID=A0A0D7W2Q6_9FLAO|nr:T9SS type A sorting domain-containing protein [Tamlana nanhaiensis]KJD33371.1 hypothetical protein PK35_05790 [Tamlana nanhaiensis]
MKQLLLFFFSIFFSWVISAQATPAGCEDLEYYKCDSDNDGFETFNLKGIFPFPFCNASSYQYESTQYFLTEEDMNNGTNTLTSYQASYYTVNTGSQETIYFRARYRSSWGNNYIKNSAQIGVLQSTLVYNIITDFVTIDEDRNGVEKLPFASITNRILSDQKKLKVSYYFSQNDAENKTNEILPSDDFNSNTLVTLFARVENEPCGLFEIFSFNFYVDLPKIDVDLKDLYVCQDYSSYTGFGSFNLETISDLVEDEYPELDVLFYEGWDNSNNVGTNRIYNTENYTNLYNHQVIYVYIFNPNNLQDYIVKSLKLTVERKPIWDYDNLYECDTGAIDGIAEFNSNDAKIYVNNTSVGGLALYRTQEDAEADINKLPQYFQNLKPYKDIVYFRYQYGNCLLFGSIYLYVNNCANKGVLSISAFYDENKNGSFSITEDYFSQGTFTYEKNNDGVIHNVDASRGFFTIESENDTDKYTISYTLFNELTNCYEVTDEIMYNVSVSSGKIKHVSFPVVKKQTCRNIAVALLSDESPRPGFNYSNRLQIKNSAHQTINSLKINFEKDENVEVIEVLGVSPENTLTTTNNGFVLNIQEIGANETETLFVNMSVPSSLNLGDVLTNSASVSIYDYNSTDNSSTLTETVVSSYDPNDILESHGPEIIYDDFTTDDYLYYTIRFQNVGTADAINISIDNTLDSKLDKSTIQMLTSSHDYVFTRTNNQLNWQFDDIHLPSEDMDEPNSHGYVYYKIKPTAGYSVDDIIPNKAEIYFDFNEPIITNTFETKFVNETTLSKEGFYSQNFYTYPNPTSENLDLIFNTASKGLIEITAFDLQGKLIFKTNKVLDNNKTHLNVSKLKSGFYILKVKKDGIESVRKLIVE